MSNNTYRSRIWRHQWSETGIPLNRPPPGPWTLDCLIIMSRRAVKQNWKHAQTPALSQTQIPFGPVQCLHRLYCENRHHIQFNGVPTGFGIPGIWLRIWRRGIPDGRQTLCETVWAADYTSLLLYVSLFFFSLGADFNIVLILCNFSRVALLCSCIQRSLSPPTHTVYVPLRTPLSCACWKLFWETLCTAGNLQPELKSMRQAYWKGEFLHFSAKSLLEHHRTGYLILTEYSREASPLQSRVITAFPLMKTYTKDQTGARDGELGTLKVPVHHWVHT